MMLHAIVSMLWLAGASGQPELRPVDAGSEDVSPDRVSTLRPRIDQRQGGDFGQVFAMTKPNGKTVYVRVSGGVYAEFDRSVYAEDGSIEIPPGTRFGIGRPAAGHIAPPVNAPTRVDLSARSGQRHESTPASTRHPVALGTPSIMNNELYRSVRVSQLLHDTLHDR